MNPLNLIWIIPLSACFGAFVRALFKGGSEGYEQTEQFSQNGETYGVAIATPISYGPVAQ